MSKPKHVGLAAMLVFMASLAPAQTKLTDWSTVKALATGGAVLGAIIGAAAHQDCSGWCFFNTSRGANAAGEAIALGGIGAIVGALIPSRSWLEIYRQ